MSQFLLLLGVTLIAPPRFEFQSILIDYFFSHPRKPEGRSVYFLIDKILFRKFYFLILGFFILVIQSAPSRPNRTFATWKGGLYRRKKKKLERMVRQGLQKKSPEFTQKVFVYLANEKSGFKMSCAFSDFFFFKRRKKNNREKDGQEEV